MKYFFLRVTILTALFIIVIPSYTAAFLGGRSLGDMLNPQTHIDVTRKLAEEEVQRQKAIAEKANRVRKAADEKAKKLAEKEVQRQKSIAEEANRIRKAADEKARKLAEKEVQRQKSIAEEANRIRKAADEKAVKKVAEDAQQLGEKLAKESINATQDTVDTIKTGKVHGDIGIEAMKTGDNIVKNFDKFYNDSLDETDRFGKNLEELVQAVVHASEDELDSAMQNMSDAEKRIGEGKIIDAVWHTAVDPAKGTSKNWATAATNSSYLNTVGQSVATVYGGGAGGAAAYAAWLTYEQTGGDLEAAIKQGIISGVTTHVSAGASKIPSDFKRMVTKAAISAAAVAANGGTEEDMRKGALIAGGVVIIQVGYREYTGAKFDPTSSEGEAMCKGSPGADCAPSADAYDKDGNLDMRKLSQEEVKKPQVGSSFKKGESGITLENSKAMTAVSRFPVMNAMGLGHDIFVDDLADAGLSGTALDVANKVTIVPAMVIAYSASGAPTYTFIQEVGIKKHKDNNKKVTDDINNLHAKLE